MATRVETRTIEIRTCDECGKSGQHSGRIGRCLGCGKDIGRCCGLWWDEDPWTGDPCGDYSEIVCQSCDNVIHDLSDAARLARVELDEKIDKLQAEWKERCQAKTE